MTIDAQDYDPPVGNGAFTLGQIGSPFFDINRPSAPNEAFTAMMTSSMGQATITYRYRVICTDGSCGNDCSQTTGCNPWTPACESITTQPDTPAPGVEPTSPLDPCVQNPCRNGGTCMVSCCLHYFFLAGCFGISQYHTWFRRKPMFSLVTMHAMNTINILQPIRPGEYRCNCRNGFTGRVIKNVPISTKSEASPTL